MKSITGWGACKTLTAFFSLGAGLSHARPDGFQTPHLQKSTRGHWLGVHVPPEAPLAPRLAPKHWGHTSARPPAVTVVVAHFDEDLAWLAGHKKDAMVYCKDPKQEARLEMGHWTPLPNVGCESHTYLWHIVHHYHHLANITLFSQGRIEDSVDRFVNLDSLIEHASLSPYEMTIFRSTFTFGDWNQIIHNGKWEAEKNSGRMQPAATTPGHFWSWLFDGERPPEQIEWAQGATFAVNHRAIERRPLVFYQRLLSYFEALNQTKPEEGHYMERFWMTIFGYGHGFHETPSS